MNTDDTPRLKPVIRLSHATAMVVGIIIGASIFVQPSEITGRVPSIGGVLLVWSVSGFLTFLGVLVCAELASLFPRTGGVYVFLREAYSPSLGFLWGWAMFWSMHSGIIAAIAMIFSRYAGFFVPLDNGTAKAVAIAAIIVISGINYIGVKQGSSLQAFMTLGKIAAIVFIILAGFLLGSRLPEHFSSGSFAHGGMTLGGFLQALVAGLFAFGGWHMVTYNSEETVDPAKTIPRALMLGTAIVTAGYIVLNVVYMYILPLDKVARSTRIAADAADAVVGSGGGAFMSALVVFSTFGALAGIILCGPRVYFAMSRDGLLFSRLGDIHPRFRTPGKAIALQMVWSSVLVATGTYRVLFTRVVFTEWIFFGLMAIGLIILRKRNPPSRRSFFRGSLFVPVLFSAASFAIVAHQLAVNPGESLVGLSLVLTGLPVYYFWTKKRGAAE